MKLLIGILLILISNICAADLKYCSGTIKEIITRDSTEATYIVLSTSDGVSGAAKIGDSNGYNDYQKVQISMLIAAYMSNKRVSLELNTTGFSFNSCTDFQTGIPVRFVMFR